MGKTPTGNSSRKKTADSVFLAAFRLFLHEYTQRSMPGILPLLSPDCVAIGSAIQEVADTFENTKKMLAEDFKQINTPVQICNENFKVNRINEQVALIMGTFAMRGECDGQHFEIPNFRCSALYHCDENGPLLCHWHASLPQEDAGIPESFPIRRLTNSLYETEEKFRLIFENAPVGLLHYDHNGIVKECNRKFLQLMSSTAEKIIGMDLTKLPDQQALAAITNSLKGRNGFYEGYYCAVTSGKVTPLKALCTPVFGSFAQVVGGIAIYEDTSEYKIAENKLHYQFQFEKIIATISSSFVNNSSTNIKETIRNALKLTCQFFDADRCYIFQINPDGEYATNTYEWGEPGIELTMHKYESVPLANLNGLGGFMERLCDHIHIPDIEQFPPSLEAARSILSAGAAKSVLILPLVTNKKLTGCFGYDCVNKSRSWTYEEITLLKVVGEIFSNAFAKQAAENKLQESEEKYRLLAENATDVIWIADVEKEKFIYISPSAEKLFGMRVDEITASPLPARMTHESAEAFISKIPERIANMRSGKQDRYTDEADQLHQNGTIIPTEVTTNFILDPVSQHVLIIGVTRDITLRKEAERQRALLEAQKLQNQKADSLGRMAGAIAHHFNNQLQVVMGNLELLTAELKDSYAGKKRLGDAMKATTRAAELSSLMLSYLGQTKSKAESLNIIDSCRMQIPLLKEMCPKNISIEQDFIDEEVYVRADPAHLQQILRNIFTNAFEAIGEKKGKVSISVRQIQADQIPIENRHPLDWQPATPWLACLEISDNGCGIEQQDINKVFDPFFSSKFTGRGLGLPVALGYMRSVSGAVGFKTTVNKGSAFSFYFNICEHGRTEQNEIHINSNDKAAEGIVLLVEDEEMVRFITRNLLEHFNYHVVEAKDGEEALELFKIHRQQIKLVICDLVMPGIDGWQTLEALRELSPALPVILASGYDQSLVMKGSHSQLPSAFLSKPYGAKGLQQAISTALSSHPHP